MTERLVLGIADGFAICADQNQWIICRAQMRRDERYWQPLAFIGSTRSILRRVLREKSIDVDPYAKQVIELWPETFRDWLAQNAIHACEAANQFGGH